MNRWGLLYAYRVPTLSFYEFIDLLGTFKPEIDADLNPTTLSSITKEDLTSLMLRLLAIQKYFHQCLLVGGFPEVAVVDDVSFAQKMIREDVVDKVLKRDMVSLFGIRNVAELEKIFLYLCMVSGNIVVQDTIAKEIGVSRQTVSNYLELLEQANLIYISKPVELKGKKILKARPKIYLADAAIRNAVLMIGEKEILTDPAEMGMAIETVIYKHIHSFYNADHPKVGYFRDPNSQKEIDIIVSFPMRNILIEVKYKEQTQIEEKEAIVEWADNKRTQTAILVTKNNDDYGISSHNTHTPIIKIPAFAFLYLLGHAERRN